MIVTLPPPQSTPTRHLPTPRPVNSRASTVTATHRVTRKVQIRGELPPLPVVFVNKIPNVCQSVIDRIHAVPSRVNSARVSSV